MSGAQLPRSGCAPLLTLLSTPRVCLLRTLIFSVACCIVEVACRAAIKARAAAQEAALAELRTSLSSHGVPQDKCALFSSLDHTFRT